MDFTFESIEQVKDVIREFTKDAPERMRQRVLESGVGEDDLNNNRVCKVKMVRRSAFMHHALNPLKHTTVIVGEGIFGFGGDPEDLKVCHKSHKERELYEFQVGAEDLLNNLTELEIETGTIPFGVNNNCNRYAQKLYDRCMKLPSFYKHEKEEPTFENY